MHGSNPNRICGTCGNDVPVDGEAARYFVAPGRHGVFCLRCERQNLAGDLDAAAAVLEVVRAAARAALSYVSPQDVNAVVAETIAEMKTVPAETMDELGSRFQRNRERERLDAIAR